MFWRCCPCFTSGDDDDGKQKDPEDVKVLDYSHQRLRDVPGEVFQRERLLEELYLDNNLITGELRGMINTWLHPVVCRLHCSPRWLRNLSA